MKKNNISTGLKTVLEQAQRNPIAAYNAAIILEEEWREEGKAAAQHFYLRSALGGYVPAMLRIAGFYLTGQLLADVEYDSSPRTIFSVTKGFEWIKRAADTGDSTANYMLARCYADGISVKQSDSSACACLHRVAFSDGINPYKPTEALIFGSVSDNLCKCVQAEFRVRSLSQAC